jgi:hypothetical protein
LLPFFAGVDTVGRTDVFILYEMLRHPELLERVRTGADSLFDAGNPSPHALREAHDLNGAVTEALRVHPVAFAMPRAAARDFEVEGFRVVRGESVMVFTSACQFDPAYFPAPERFDIDRYQPPRDERRRPDVFAPWGRGSHQCLGAGLAGVQMAATIATILHYCDIELAEPDRDFPTSCGRRSPWAPSSGFASAGGDGIRSSRDSEGPRVGASGALLGDVRGRADRDTAAGLEIAESASKPHFSRYEQAQPSNAEGNGPRRRAAVSAPTRSGRSGDWAPCRPMPQRLSGTWGRGAHAAPSGRVWDSDGRPLEGTELAWATAERELQSPIHGRGT